MKPKRDTQKNPAMAQVESMKSAQQMLDASSAPVPLIIKTVRERLDRMRDWTSLSDTIKLPADLMAAVASGRPQLLALFQPRAFTAEEAQSIVHALAVFMETNQKLQRHCQVILTHVELLNQSVNGFTTQIDNLRKRADFSTLLEEDKE